MFALVMLCATAAQSRFKLKEVIRTDVAPVQGQPANVTQFFIDIHGQAAFIADGRLFLESGGSYVYSGSLR